MGSQNNSVKIVMLFWNIVWPSAMKFGTMRGIGALQILRNFGDLWSGGFAIPCGDMNQSFTDALDLLFSAHVECSFKMLQ